MRAMRPIAAPKSGRGRGASPPAATAGLWRLTLHDARDRTRYETLIGARARQRRRSLGGRRRRRGRGQNAPVKVRLVKGSHIVVDRLFDHDRAYIFQNADGRICFAIPFERDYTLIGTTDEDFTGDPAKVAIDDGETGYLIAAVSEYFRRRSTAT